MRVKTMMSSRRTARSDTGVRHHALVILADNPARGAYEAADATSDRDDARNDGGNGANAAEREQRRWERFITVAQRSVREYVFLAQQIQTPPPRSRAVRSDADNAGSDSDAAAAAGSDNEHAPRRRRSDNASTPVDDSDAVDSSSCRLLLSVNVLTAANARAIASQQVGMERPVAVSPRNTRLLRDVCEHVDACLSRARATVIAPQSRTSNSNEENAVGDHVADALVRALEWFADSSFAVSVVAPADAIAGFSGCGDASANSRRAVALASALRGLGSVQFVLHRSDDERAERASRNILHLLSAIRDSGNVHCEIRQVEDVAFQMRGVVKEWLYRASPSVTATITRTDLGDSFDSSADLALALTLDIRSNYVLPVATSASGLPLTQPLHSGMRRMEIVHIAPMASVHLSVLVGCPLHGSLPPTSPLGDAAATAVVRANAHRLEALARFLRAESCGVVLRCVRQTHAEFFVMVPATAKREGVEFLLFRVASAEEVLVPPPRTEKQQLLALAHSAGADEAIATAALASIRAIPRDDFNPFRYESGLVTRDIVGPAQPTCRSVAAAASEAAATTRGDSAIDARLKTRSKRVAAARVAPSTTRLPPAKRKKLL